MPERVLVTGGTGFIGAHLVRRLLSDGDEVHMLVRQGGTATVPRGVTAVVDPGTTAGLASILGTLRPATCFHLATKFVAQHRAEDVEDLVTTNVGFATRVAEALPPADRPIFVNTGTAWQHVEGAAYRPSSLYAATKQAFQDVLTYYAEAGRLRVVNLKLVDTYGPEDERPKLVNVLLDAARTGSTVEMSPGEQLIDLLHVDDAVEAFLHARSEAHSGEAEVTRAASSGEPVTLRSLVRTVEQVTGERLGVAFGAKPYRAVEMFTPWDIGRAPRGWTPKVRLEEGLARLWHQRRDLH